MFFKVILIAATFVNFANASRSFEEVDEEVCIGLYTGDTVPIGDNCKYYYTCFNQLGYMQDCGANFIYDTKINSCVQSNTKMDCLTRSFGLRENEEKIIKEACMGYIDRKLLQVKRTCSKYYDCENETGFIDDCLRLGNNFYFDSSIGMCVEGPQYNCISGNVVHLINRNSYEKIKISPPDYDMNLCRGYADGNVFGVEGSCNYYYICSEQMAYLQSCKSFGEEYQFDAILNDCVQDVKCNENYDVLN